MEIQNAPRGVKPITPKFSQQHPSQFYHQPTDVVDGMEER